MRSMNLLQQMSGAILALLVVVGCGALDDALPLEVLATTRAPVPTTASSDEEPSVPEWRVYYVAPTGSDSNPGTEAEPWQTIQKAADTLVAGDTVYIKAGTYEEQVIAQQSGSAGNPITYAAYPGDEVTIDGAGVSLPPYETGLFVVEDRSHIKVSGLRIMNAGPNENNAGIYVDNSSHIVVENNDTYNTVSSGIGVWGSDNVIIAGNEVELACNDGEQECISVAGTDTFEIRGNHVHHGGPGTNGGEGITVKDGSSNGRVYENLVHDIVQGERTGIYLDAWDKHTFNIEVYRNVVHDCSAGISLASEKGGLLENVRITNNIVYGNATNGFEIGDWGVVGVIRRPVESITFVNNTSQGNGSGEWGGGIHFENPDTKNIVVRNNIFSENILFQISNEAVPEGQLVVDHNLIHDYVGEYEYEIRGDDVVEGDPLFVDLGAADFHLREGSPAIDTGSSADAPGDDVEGNARPQDGDGDGEEAFDIGAYEAPFYSEHVHLPVVLRSA